jgi:hypothetical protein
MVHPTWRQEGLRLRGRALGYGGQVFEDDRPNTLVALRKGLREEGIEPDHLI